MGHLNIWLDSRTDEFGKSSGLFCGLHSYFVTNNSIRGANDQIGYQTEFVANALEKNIIIVLKKENNSGVSIYSLCIQYILLLKKQPSSNREKYARREESLQSQHYIQW